MTVLAIAAIILGVWYMVEANARQTARSHCDCEPYDPEAWRKKLPCYETVPEPDTEMDERIARAFGRPSSNRFPEIE